MARSQLFILVVLFILSGASSAWAQASDYEAAMSLVQQGQFDRALPLLQRILAQSPNDLKARNLTGIALSAAGRPQEANEQFRQVLALDPKFFPALKNLAFNEVALGRTEDARRHFEEALQLAPQDPACHWGLAELAFAAGDFVRAAAHYERSGDLALRDPRVALRFAGSYAETGQPHKAAALLERLPAEADAQTQFQAGLLLAKLERFAAAARRFELARPGYKDSYQAGFNLVLMLVRSRDYAAAVRAGEELVAAGHRRAELYNLLAQAYEEGGKTSQAYESLRAATRLEPQDETNYLDLITLCVKHNNYELSLEIANIGLRLIPRSDRLHLQQGVILALSGRYEDAAQAFQTAGQLAPASGLPHVALGLVLLQLEKLPEAIDVLRRQREKTPDDAEVLWFLGEALNRSGITRGSEVEKEALGALTKSIELNPRLAAPRALLGKLLLRRGEINRAVEELEKALELDPQDITITYQLAQALLRRGETARAKELFAQVDKAKNEEREFTRRNLLRIVKSGSP